jgi:hypothetical protein
MEGYASRSQAEQSMLKAIPEEIPTSRVGKSMFPESFTMYMAGTNTCLVEDVTEVYIFG